MDVSFTQFAYLAVGARSVRLPLVHNELRPPTKLELCVIFGAACCRFADVVNWAKHALSEITGPGAVCWEVVEIESKRHARSVDRCPM